MSQKSGFTVNHVPDRAALEQQSALAIADSLRSLLARQDRVRAVFAAAASQLGTLTLLRQQDGIDWHRMEAFHMDEYVGLPAEHPARFGNWLKRNVFDHLPLAAVHLIEPDGDAQAAAQDYAAKLAAAPIDLVCLGIGVNGHIAFNDPRSRTSTTH
ncbi:6-phosphogluconolactonase [Devosia ginsengisoli]|uniref:6-phosphogluconolactonase n=1 Tax=Devosia ginsengisoli TaxID=400770 RepID=UPI002482C90D|nr:6-phosphogluconolactonase [Devosia ginsengisoli]